MNSFNIPASRHPGIPADERPCFLLTIDVEDWFQVENFKSAIPFSSWNDMELRVEKNTHKLLDLFDETSKNNPISHQPSAMNTPLRATFFILGWVAERLPGLVKEIQNRGHEIASHGFCHHLCSEQNTEDLRKDLVDSRELLEDIIGSKVHGYRAPSFSVNNDTLKIIEDAGYHYDASYNSFDKHGRYGKLNLNGFEKRGIAYQVSSSFHEIPVSNISCQLSAVSHQPLVLPWSGGGYFRLFPLSLFKMGIRKMLTENGAYHFYLHPWEIDPGQPRVDTVSRMFRFRHYVNIGKTIDKVKKMLSEFRYCRFQTLSEHLEIVLPKV